jgi:very-short-patch-repair endonuclease
MPQHSTPKEALATARVRARRLRHEQTDAERELWWHLRRKMPLIGTHFRRQVVIGPYIADFASHRLKIVIELDGSQHAEAGHARRDAVRIRVIESHGYRVLRFWNPDVLSDVDSVLETIRAAAEDTHSPSLPTEGAIRVNPSCQGGGA